MYCAAAAPAGLLATLNGAVGSLHYSFGRGLGSFIGGIFMARYGTRTTFQIFGAASGCIGICYFFLHRFYLINFEILRTRRKSGIVTFHEHLINHRNYRIDCVQNKLLHR